jgi:dCMP deaminase
LRPTKAEYYLEIAKAVCLRSPCIRRKFGALVVREDVVVSSGYNGPARGVINCSEVGCIKDEFNLPHYSAYDECPGLHAEENSILNAARHGACVLGGTLYITGLNPDGTLTEARPCDRCKRAIINAGIGGVVIRKSDGGIEHIDTSEWVGQDTKRYLERLKGVRNKPPFGGNY